MSTSGELWVGSSLGILKGSGIIAVLCILLHSVGVSLDRKETLNYLPAGVPLSQTDKSMEVVAMCWDNQSQDQVEHVEAAHIQTAN